MAGSDEVRRTRALNSVANLGCAAVGHDPWHLGAQGHKLLTRDLGDLPQAVSSHTCTLMDGCQGRSADGSVWAAEPRGLRLTLFPTSHGGRIAVAGVSFRDVDGLIGVFTKLRAMLLGLSTVTRYGITSKSYENKTTCVCIAGSRT